MWPSWRLSISWRAGDVAIVRIRQSPSSSRGWRMKNRLSRQCWWWMTTLGSGSGIWWTKSSSIAVSLGIGLQELLCVEIEGVAAGPLGHGHEHVVAAVGAADEHRGDDRHVEAAEGVAAVGRPAVGLVERDAVGFEAVAVTVEQAALVGAPVVDEEAAAEEVAEVADRM